MAHLSGRTCACQSGYLAVSGDFSRRYAAHPIVDFSPHISPSDAKIAADFDKLIYALLLLLAGFAAPAVAQTTVTSGGRDGPTTCINETEVGDSLLITQIATNFIRYTTPPVTWNQYVGRLGDASPPINVNIRAGVYNASTEALVGQALLANITNTNNYNGTSTPLIRSGLSAKTLYYLEVYAQQSGSIPKQVFARRCFMTGGAYTMNVAPSTEGRTSGCFSISEVDIGIPRTIQHVRNCWCGRKTTLSLFSSDQDNTNFLNSYGCK